MTAILADKASAPWVQGPFVIHGAREGIRFGSTVMWTDRSGACTVVTVSDCETLDEARRSAMHSAKSLGWTPPRWWQWWRWGDLPRKEGA